MKNNDTGQNTQQGQRILLVEDYEVNQKIGQMFLQKAGFNVDIAENGQQAVEAYHQNHYDLILMDIQMPIMDGYQATVAIRNLESKIQHPKSNINSHSNSAIPNPQSPIRKVPIIAMTGNTSEEGLDPEDSLGINECIRKPAQWDQVLLVVKKWIDADSKSSMINPLKDASHPPVRGKKATPAPLDMDKVIEEFMGQKEILFEILEEFIKRVGVQVDNIRRAVDRSDYGVIFSEAHAIKGGAANLTADPLADVAADLEKAAAEQQTDETVILVEKMAIELNQLKNYLQPKLTKSKKSFK